MDQFKIDDLKNETVYNLILNNSSFNSGKKYDEKIIEFKNKNSFIDKKDLFNSYYKEKEEIFLYKKFFPDNFIGE